MAALAQHRAARRQHARMVGAVRIMTSAAVLGDRRVFPQVGAALFGVAAEAGVVQRLPGELPLAGFTMRAVTPVAGHLALANRVRVGLHGLRALLLMAVEAHLRLRRGCKHGVCSGVSCMAIRTGEIIRVVIIAVPTESRIAIVAGQAHTVAVFG